MFYRLSGRKSNNQTTGKPVGSQECNPEGTSRVTFAVLLPLAA